MALLKRIPGNPELLMHQQSPGFAMAFLAGHCVHKDMGIGIQVKLIGYSKLFAANGTGISMVSQSAHPT